MDSVRRLRDGIIARSARLSAVAGLVLAAIASPLSAQQPQGITTATLSGSVVDAQSDQPIGGAIVSVPALSRAVQTDSEGMFELPDLPIGTHVVRVQQFGYDDLVTAVSIELSGAPVVLQLEPDPLMIEGLDVSVDGFGALTGRVTEGSTGQPMAGVVVWLSSEERGASSDSLGRFLVPEVPYGPQLIHVERAGYGRQYIPVQLGSSWTPIEIVLQPDLSVLEALPIVSARLRARRNMYERIVTVHDTERLIREGVGDIREYIQKYTLVNVIPCSGDTMSFWCIGVGGRPVEPQVCVDGWLEWGGLDVLQRFSPNELHLLEVFAVEGLIIRAYTHTYMETLAGGRGGGVLALEPAPQREGVEGLGWSSARSDAQPSLLGRC